MIGWDRLLGFFCLNPGLLVGLWKEEEKWAFVIADLHFHHFVEKSTLGSATDPLSYLLLRPLWMTTQNMDYLATNSVLICIAVECSTCVAHFSISLPRKDTLKMDM